MINTRVKYPKTSYKLQGRIIVFNLSIIVFLRKKGIRYN